MITPLFVTPEIVDQIVTIGKERLPAEACGLLLPTPHRGEQVIELPNRSKVPQTQFEIHRDDIMLTLERLRWAGSVSELTIWHTHPSGLVGPSFKDLEVRVEATGNLVVSMGEKPLASWY